MKDTLALCLYGVTFAALMVGVYLMNYAEMPGRLLGLVIAAGAALAAMAILNANKKHRR